MKSLNVGDTEQQDVVALIVPLEKDIVEKP
jgi:hypothetical protein